MDKDGHTRITDFGLSISVDEIDPKRDDVCSGTVEYFSPEILLDKQQSFASDWWAYGVVVFEVIVILVFIDLV